MAFQKESPKTPIGVGRIEVILRDFPGETQPQSILFQVNIFFSDGSTTQRVGDLQPQLTPTQITQLTNFMAAIRTKAVAEFIG